MQERVKNRVLSNHKLKVNKELDINMKKFQD